MLFIKPDTNNETIQHSIIPLIKRIREYHFKYVLSNFFNKENLIIQNSIKYEL